MKRALLLLPLFLAVSILYAQDVPNPLRACLDNLDASQARTGNIYRDPYTLDLFWSLWSIEASRDIVNIGGDIASKGDATLAAGRDIRSEALETTSGFNMDSDVGTTRVDTVEQHKATITAGDDLALASGRDIALAATDVAAGGDARIEAGREKMIAALNRLKGGVPEPLPEQLAAFGVSGAQAGGIRRLLEASRENLRPRDSSQEKMLPKWSLPIHSQDGTCYNVDWTCRRQL